MKLLRTLGFIWLLPATIIVWLFYVLPVWVFGEVHYEGMHSLFVWKFRVSNLASWYTGLWSDWAGWSGPCVIFYKDQPGTFDDAWVERTLIHEDDHCFWQFVFGVFFYPIYSAASLGIWLFGGEHRHAYLDNPFERRARQTAGQVVDIPRDRWMHGAYDRWAWW